MKRCLLVYAVAAALVASASALTLGGAPTPAAAQAGGEALASAGGVQLTRSMVADGTAFGEFLAGQTFSAAERQSLADQSLVLFQADPAGQAQTYAQVATMLATIRSADQVERARLRQDLMTNLYFSPGGRSSPLMQVVYRYAPAITVDPNRRLVVTGHAIDALFASNDAIADIAGHPASTPADRAALVAELPQAFPGLAEGQQRMIANAEERWARLQMILDRMTPAAREQTIANVRTAAPTPAHVPTVARNLETSARVAAMENSINQLAARYFEILPDAFVPSMIGAANAGFQ